MLQVYIPLFTFIGHYPSADIHITLNPRAYSRRNYHAPTFSVSLVFNVILKGSLAKVSSYEALKSEYNQVAQRIMEWRIVAKRIEESRIVKKRTED